MLTIAGGIVLGFLAILALAGIAFGMYASDGFRFWSLMGCLAIGALAVAAFVYVMWEWDGLATMAGLIALYVVWDLREKRRMEAHTRAAERQREETESSL